MNFSIDYRPMKKANFRTWLFTLAVIILSPTCLFCQDTPRLYSLKIVTDSVYLNQETEGFALTKGTLVQWVDLNHDQRKDLIVAFGNCGNWGDCIFGFFTDNGSGAYTCVFEEYLPRFSIASSSTVVQGVAWKDFTLLEHSSDKNGNPSVVEKKMFFDGQAYRTQ
jgi:hypothetical protein